MFPGLGGNALETGKEVAVPGKKRPSVKNEKQYEGLRKKGMSKERAAKIANTPNASSKGGKKAAAKRRKKKS
jgi:hypothetical protein